MQLLYARNIELASTAAEAVTLLAQNSNSSTPSAPAAAAAAAAGSALGTLTPAAVQGLGELVKECAAHAYALGLGRRGGSSSNTALQQQQQQQSASEQPGSSRRSFSSVPGAGDMLRPIPEAGSLDGSSTVDSLADAAEAAGVAWSAQRQQQQQALQSTSSIVMRHPSLDRTSLPGSGITQTGTLQQQAAALAASLLNAAPQQGGGSAAAAALTSRQRPRVSSSGNTSLQCLVCAHAGHDCCGACPLSAALTALRLLLTPQPKLQGLLVGSGVLQVLVGLAAGEAGGIQHGKLLGALAGLLAVAVTGNTAAQDQVREAEYLSRSDCCAVLSACALWYLWA
jgi:hypothetical protein